METSSAGSLLSVALAVLAIVLGGAGLYFGMTANQRLGPLADTMEEGSGSAVRLERDITALETKLAELSAQKSEMESTLERLRVSGTQSERAVRQIADGVRENRSEMVKLAGRLNELLASGGVSAAQEPAAAGNRQEPPEASAEPAADTATAGGTYTIKAGDNFVRIANQLGIGLQALIEANPDVDPRRLRIGQEVKIPAN